MAQNEFAQFKQKKEELAKIIRETSVIMNDLSLHKSAERLQQLAAQVNNDSFKIQIVGTFKNGKSTFINALLGEDILPSKALPCTAVINEVKYGSEKSAVLTFCDPLPKHLLDCIPAPTLNHMKSHGLRNVPPMVIDPDNMEDYVTIPTDGDPEEISEASPYRSVELLYPAEVLKDGVEIIDSPGLNECKERTKVTVEYLKYADAIIYLLDAAKACAENEMEMIEGTLIPMGFDDMFFVTNRFDLIRAAEREKVKKFIKDRVGNLTSNELFFISALKAVEGKTGFDYDGDELSEDERKARLEKSGITPFEARLIDFLTNDKGRIKLTRPARELNNIITKETLHTAIPQQKAMLSTDYKTLEKRYKDATPKLKNLEDQRRDLYDKMEKRIINSTNSIRRDINQYFVKLSPKVSRWIDEYQPTNSPGFGSKRKIQACADDITKYITEKIKKDFEDWNKSALQDIINIESNKIFEDTEVQVGDFFKDLDIITGDISGQKVESCNVKPWERLVGAGLVMLIPGATTGTSMMAGGFDPKNFAKNIGIDLGIGLGIIALGIANPVLLIGALVGMIWRGVITGKAANLQRVKDGVRDAILESIANSKDEQADNISGEIKNKLMEIANATVTVLDDQIKNVKSQVDAVLNEMKEGHTKIEARMRMLNTNEKKLQDLSNQLDEMIFDLAEKK